MPAWRPGTSPWPPCARSEEEFGPYPWPTLTVAMAPLANYSMELPQVSLIGLQLYRAFASELEQEIAFSVAHQWWSQLVQNDPINAPWLDEALSTLAVLLYQERLHGEETAATYRIRKLEIPVAAAPPGPGPGRTR